MSKYKLINRTIKEEHLCDKVTIDGFDYYVSDETPEHDNYITYKNRLFIIKNGDNELFHLSKKVIATNNPNIDIPKIVDEIDLLSYINKLANQRFTGWTNDEMKGYKTALISVSEFYKSQQTHPFNENDMIEFKIWCDNNTGHNWTNLRYKSTKELLQLWKEQQPKTLYFEIP